MAGNEARKLDLSTSNPEEGNFKKATELANKALGGRLEAANDTIYTIRDQVGQLADQLNPFISAEAARGYQQMAQGREQKITIEFLKNNSHFKPLERQRALEIYALVQKAIQKGEVTQVEGNQWVEDYLMKKIGAEFLKDSLSFGEDYKKAAFKIYRHIQGAITDDHISPTQESAWVKRYILANEFNLVKDFASIEQAVLQELSPRKQAEAYLQQGLRNKIISQTDIFYLKNKYSELSTSDFNKKVGEKMKNRESDKIAYLDILKHPAAKKIKLGGGLDLLLNEAKFLESTVPLRKKFYEALVIALKDWDLYKARVQAAVEAKWMNEATAAKFLEAFPTLDSNTRKAWKANMSEWTKREKLRNEVNQLTGQNRAYMEKKFKELGFTAFEALFRENQKALADYLEALQTYKNDKRFNLRQTTYNEYVAWAQNQPFPILKQALHQLSHPEQMGRFAAVQKQMEALTVEQRAELEEKYNEANYEERKRLVNEAQKSVPQAAQEGAEDPNALTQIASTAVRKGVTAGIKKLDASGFKKFQLFLRRTLRNPKTAQSFEEGVRKAKALALRKQLMKEQAEESRDVSVQQKQNPVAPIPANDELYAGKINHAPDAQIPLPSEVEQAMSLGEEAKVINIDSFQRVIHAQGEAFRVDLNDAVGMREMLARSGDSNRNTAITLGVGLAGGNADLNLAELKAVSKHMDRERPKRKVA